jgi:pSer/pThr/pTyr-binding forkhead associated (FHA) protein
MASGILRSRLVLPDLFHVPLLVNITKQNTIELKDEPIIIGRDASCNVSILDALLSRTHAEISQMSNGRYKIVDLGSTHGTFLSGKRISESILVSGDEIVLGATRLRFYENAAEYSAGEVSSGEDAKTSAIDPLESYPYLESIWQTGADFLSSYQLGSDPGRFYYSVSRNEVMTIEVEPGALISLDIRFLDRDTSFHVHTRVIERRTEGENPGLLLELVQEEKERQELVLACAKGESIPYFRRRYERISCRIPVILERTEDDKLPATAIDISEGGARLITNHSLESGIRVLLHLSFSEKKRLFFSRSRRLDCNARVVSMMAKGPQNSLGVEFLFESSQQRNLLVEEVALLRFKRSI